MNDEKHYKWMEEPTGAIFLAAATIRAGGYPRRYYKCPFLTSQAAAHIVARLETQGFVASVAGDAPFYVELNISTQKDLPINL